ncbi:MAG TPA: GntR family transcriptional regulator [Acidobacteriaceae bacterium]|jgi:GntR family transcriptional regulator|nr:GntR family transcriptional regulator [Acidobacteriaceae bacterium]
MDAKPPSPLLHLALDHQSYVPYYQQIVEQVRAWVKADTLREGQPFCSENEVAHALGISKMPVRQAFQKLRSEGLLTIEKGKKPLIGSGRVPWNFQELRGFSEEMRRRGLVPSARLLSSQVIGAEAEVAKALRIPAGESVYNIRRLRLVNGNAVAVVTSFLPVRLFPNIEQQDLENRSLYGLYETLYKRRLHWAEEEIGAVCAQQEEARILDTVPGSALLRIRETTFDSNRIPIEYSCSLLRGDRYTASVISVRRQTVR